MPNLLERLKKQYRYLRTQDLPLWKTVRFILEDRKSIYRAIFVKNSGSDFIVAGPVNSDDLCHEISQAIQISEEALLEYHQEFRDDLRFHQSIKKRLELTSERPNKTPQYGWREFFYIVVRAIKPKIMIETGSFDGLSTAVILLGMSKNNCGTLYTIDLSNPRLPQDIKAEPAWIVPDYLRARLELRIGKSSEHLEKVIEQVGGAVDMFYHDSWHTFENMMFEYQTVWSALCPGGYLMSEYLPGRKSAFKAFKEFVMTKAEKPVIVANGSQFILRKTVEDC